MSKKKMITIAIIALFLVVAMLIGGIYALFTRTTPALTNTFTIGNVNITLTEPNWTNAVNNAVNNAAAADPTAPAPTSPEDAQNMVPGDTCVKDPTVTNTGANPAYVFVKVEIPYYNNEQVFTLTGLDTTNWKEISSLTTTANNVKTIIYAYATAADAASALQTLQPSLSATLFTGVQLSSTNETVTAAAAAQSLNIVVTGYAIQDNIDVTAEATDTQAEVYGLFAGN